MEGDIKDLFRRFGKAFMKKDIPAVAECLAPDFEWHLPTGEIFSDKESALTFMADRFADTDGPRFSASTFAFHDDTVVQNYTVTVTGDNGETRDLAGLDVYYVRDNLIIRKDAYWKQIGV